MSKTFKIVCISDTHGKHRQINIPECDILIHAGDESLYGDRDEIEDFGEWLNEQNAGHIIWTPGNHSVEFEKRLPYSRNWLLGVCPAANILINETIEIEGIKIFGSPYTPFFMDWGFQAARTEEEQIFRRIPHIQEFWDLIQPGTDIIVTHGQPYRVLDQLPSGEFIGDYNLMATIIDIKPDLVIGGHIHSAHGQEHIDGTSFYNVSICDERYLPINPITCIDYIIEE
jgi:Icc-related predicted phosphoesterase